MYEFTAKQRHDIRKHRCFLREKSEIHGYGRFYSANPLFPISIALPSEADFRPYFHDDPAVLNVTFSVQDRDDLLVTRRDLRFEAEERSDPLAQDVLSGASDEVWYTKANESIRRDALRWQGMEHLSVGKFKIKRNAIRVGYLKAHYLVGQRARRAFFLRPDYGLWNIGTSELDEDTFKRILLSFEFLPEEFFGNLPSSS